MVRSLEVPESWRCRYTLWHIRCGHRPSKFQNDRSTVSVRVLQLSCASVFSHFSISSRFLHTTCSFFSTLLHPFQLSHFPHASDCSETPQFSSPRRPLTGAHPPPPTDTAYPHNLPEHMGNHGIRSAAVVGQIYGIQIRMVLMIFAPVRMCWLNGQYRFGYSPARYILCPCRCARFSTLQPRFNNSPGISIFNTGSEIPSFKVTKPAPCHPICRSDRISFPQLF